MSLSLPSQSPAGLVHGGVVKSVTCIPPDKEHEDREWTISSQKNEEGRDLPDCSPMLVSGYLTRLVAAAWWLLLASGGVLGQPVQPLQDLLLGTWSLCGVLLGHPWEEIGDELAVELAASELGPVLA